MKIRRKKLIKGILTLISALVVVILAASAIGSADISISDCARILLSKVPLIGASVDLSEIKPSHISILLKIRLPRILLSALIGSALSVSGVAYQGIFKNPMADPFVLGISSGAALGATFVIVTGAKFGILGLSSISVGAFAGALAAAFTVYNIGRIGNRTPVVTLLLAGIAVNYFLSSMISIVMSFNRDRMENIVFWTMGSVTTATWMQIAVALVPILLGTAYLLTCARDLNALALGEDSAKGLGVDSEKAKKTILIVASIVTASAVSVSGIIGFVGLIIPHVVRILSGPDHRTLLPFSILTGAIFLVLSDTLARTLVVPAELPIGIITSVFGAPYFLYLLYRNKLRSNVR
ncbi:MAG: iron chelate uptake ABC transporter family permease subunit [Erysipelotrichaceae bacterium]|nr:iron chelate uptake ABC transporter family permease subunit [Erysipelotrichaceae bacterium]